MKLCIYDSNKDIYKVKCFIENEEYIDYIKNIIGISKNNADYDFGLLLDGYKLYYSTKNICLYMKGV